MIRKRKRATLEAKLCLTTMALLFALLLGVGHFAMQTQQEILTDQKTEAFRAMTQTLAALPESNATGSSKAVARRLSERLKHSGSDLVYIIVTDAAGDPVFAESRRVSSKNGTGFTAETYRLVKNLAGFGGLADGKLYRETIPIVLPGGKPGKLTAAYSFASLEGVIEDLQTRVLTLFAFAFLAGVTLSVLLARSMIGPLQKVVNGAKKVADGNLAVRLDVKSDDEIGDLAGTFNSMVESLEKTHDALVARANTDGLTELHNHRSFQEHLAVEISRAERYKHVLSVLMMDIDHFKDFNDTHGHPAGDAALKEIASIIVGSVREIDLVARYGGEEFAVILAETNCDEAVQAAERIRLAVSRHCFYGTDGATVPLTVSIGVAQFPVHSAEREGLILAADMALYRAKSLGRNTVSVFEPGVTLEGGADPYKVYVLLHVDDLPAMESLAQAVDAKQRLPEGHSAEVARLAVATGQLMGLDADSQAGIRAAALLRDIAQLAVPEQIITPSDPLGHEERANVLNHPTVGHAIIQKAPHLRSMLPGLLHHHERFDGTGYPAGLSGDQIPLAGRILAVADAYMMLRYTKPNASTDELLQTISRAAGTVFDPSVVEAFLKVFGEAEEPVQMAAWAAARWRNCKNW